MYSKCANNCKWDAGCRTFSHRRIICSDLTCFLVTIYPQWMVLECDAKSKIDITLHNINRVFFLLISSGFEITILFRSHWFFAGKKLHTFWQFQALNTLPRQLPIRFHLKFSQWKLEVMINSCRVLHEKERFTSNAWFASFPHICLHKCCPKNVKNMQINVFNVHH